MNQRRSLFILYYLISAAAIAFYFRGNAPATFRFIREGVEVQATVTEVSCKSQPSLRYRYSVNGTNYEGSGDARFGNPPCEVLKAGDPVIASYLPSHPERSILGNPYERFWTEVVGIAMAAIFIPLVVLFAMFIVIRKRSAKAAMSE